MSGQTLPGILGPWSKLLIEISQIKDIPKKIDLKCNNIQNTLTKKK